MAEQKITLDDFMKLAHADLDEFEKKWRDMNAKRPTHYPNELSEPVWWEMLMYNN